MPKTLDFTGFSGNFPLKKKAGFTRYNKKAISYYMFLYPQARPDLMRAGVCVMMPQKRPQPNCRRGEGMPKTAEIRRQNRGQAAENGEKRQDIKRAGTPTGKRGNPPEPLHY